jgi:predicted Zn-dependent protease
MDVNGEMVEADVVEKQRAREIYEEIMRERRDPGLLEWTGGNVFKARVWPIFAHSSKRVRITYTQVLPLVGNKYRYSYGLQSEMLQKNPLKELSINFTCSSAAPLKTVTCPTHTVREQHTEHFAKLEFAAQEHTPTKDFEAVVELADNAPEVAVVPHKRGSDGYFLVQVTPPAPAAAERELLGEAGPLNVVLLCDTSASMDPAQRNTQLSVTTAILEALTPADTFNLAACDVSPEWAFETPQSATADNVRSARNRLVGRASLGWTDLDKAFAAALKQVGPTGHVIYLGDGIVTTGDASPQGFAERLKALYAAADSQAACHAVALGSAFEPPVLKAVGGLGGGSVRRVTADQGPVAVALELLGEITKPPVRDVKVEFRGWKTAKVYPEVLPNLVPGTQQVLIGRYLPEGQDQRGEVVVTGVRDGKPVQFAAKVTLKDAEQGNSFLPRLWARMHLDTLLEKPPTDLVKDEVIGLSEEFHIMTPYTSFLVLESDADRERFGVKRRFQMRDGEQYFQQARDDAAFALAREQMKKAGDWRVGLRRNVLTQLSGLGRNPWLGADPRQVDAYGRGESRRGLRTYNRSMDRLTAMEEFKSNGEVTFTIDENGRVLAADRNMWFGGDGKDLYLGSYFANTEVGFDADLPVSDLTPLAANKPGRPGEPDAPGFGEEGAFALRDGERMDRLVRRQEELRKSVVYETDGLSMDFQQLRDLDFDGYYDGGEFDGRGKNRFRGYTMGGGAGAFGGRSVRGLSSADGSVAVGFAGRYGLTERQKARGYSTPQRWFDAVVPQLPAPAKADAPKKPDWPADARALAALLDRKPDLAKLAGGLRFDRTTEVLAGGERVNTGRRSDLYAPTAWATRTGGDADRTVVDWCDGTERGTFLPMFGTGRTRPAAAADLRDHNPGLQEATFGPLDEPYHHMTAAVEGDVLVLRQINYPYEIRYTIDRQKRVATRVEQRNDGKPTHTVTYTDFAEAGGMWWAGKAEATDADGKVVSRTTQTVAAVPAADVAKQTADLTAGREAVLFLKSTPPKLADAKKAVAAGSATVDDRFALLAYYAGYQQWSKAEEHLAAVEALAAGKPGARWLRTVYLQASRRGEELRKRLVAEADQLAKAAPGGDRLALAQFVYHQGYGALAGNEVLDLLDRTRPVFADLPKANPARRDWHQYRVYALSHAGRQDELLALQKQLADDYPRDHGFQREYVQLLANRGDVEGALARVKVLLGQPHWSEWEAEQFRSHAADWLENRGRLTDAVAFLADWVKANPTSSNAYSRYLSALVRTGDEKTADELTAKWLAEAQVEGDVPAAAQARFQAAAALAGGQGHNLHTDRPDPKWQKHLADAARFFLRHPKHYALADHVLNAWQYRPTDEGRQVRNEILTLLAAEAADAPEPRLAFLLDRSLTSDVGGDKATWVKVADALRTRWAKTANADERERLGQRVAQVLNNRVGPDEWLAFLRVQLADGPEAYRSASVGRLFGALLTRPWTAELEAELVALLPRLGGGDADDKLSTQVVALHQLTDKMVAARNDAERKAIANPEKLSRTELAKKHADILTAARTGFAERLAKAEPTLPEGLRPWAKVERQYQLVKAGADPKPIAAETWAALGDAPKPAAKDDDEKPPTTGEELADYLRNRHLTTALYAATRAGVDPALIGRTLKYLDAGITSDPTADGWKAAKFDLLVALDRPKELEAVLAGWVKAGDPGGRWRTALGYVLAERGNLKEAIKVVEAVEKGDELGYDTYRVLAGWYLATNDRAGHEKALLDSYRQLDENTLSQLVYQKAAPWRNSGNQIPPELDVDLLRMFAVLFRKAEHPQNYLGYLQQVYHTSKDFRLLGTAADAVLGQSAGKVYPFLQGMTGVLNEVRDEATADELFGRVDALRKEGKTPTDLRAVDLLEMQVRRRAAELRNQPGPHAAQALAAMKRAYDRPWADGEPVTMSNLLAGLGAISRQELADEQLRELKELHAGAKMNSFERLQMAHNHGSTLAGYGRRDEAAAVLRAALDEYAAAHGGSLPSEADGALMALVSVYHTQRRYDRAEEYLAAQVAKPANDGQADWLRLRLNETYHAALSNDAKVSLGQGAELYGNLEKRLVKELTPADPDQRGRIVYLLCSVYRTAHGKKVPTVAADLKAFAANSVPGLLKGQPAHADQITSPVAQAVREIAGPADGVAFLLDRMDAEPAWLKRNNQDGWARHGSWLSQWRHEAKVLPADVEARLLKVVLAELKEDLRTGRGRNRTMYYLHHGYYWPEKEADFAAAAEGVLKERKDSEAGVRYIAEYFYQGCNRPARAIEVLFDADDRKLLDTSGRLQLVTYLHGQNRYAESVPVLDRLVEKDPAVLHYWALLCRAHFQAKDTEKVKATFAAAETHFREKVRWGHDAMHVLAHTAVECRLDERAVAILGELIPLHQRTAPNRGVGDGQLTQYYQLQPRAFSGLGRTSEAVEAASGAVVSWGGNVNGRTQALRTLEEVLAAARDLDQVAARLDAQSAETGLVNPTVRKALGKVLLDKGKPREAAVQCQVALSGQPNDAETLQLLVDSYDRANDPNGAVAAVLRALEFNRRDVKRYESLGDRLTAMKRGEEAERAYTSIVEALPNEAEGHQLLAEVRQKQGRWAEAISHWEQVARFRALEPTGLLGLANAQLHEKRFADAAETLKKLKAKPWPANFADAPQRIADLERQLQAK